MGRIMAVDYGSKRTGIAVTDPLKLIPNGLETVNTPQLLTFISAYLERESVEILLVGMPVHSDGSATKLEEQIKGFIKKFKEIAPDITVERIEESFSSVRAREAILQSGASQKKRRDKGLVDKISAVILLQDFLDSYNTHLG